MLGTELRLSSPVDLGMGVDISCRRLNCLYRIFHQPDTWMRIVNGLTFASRPRDLELMITAVPLALSPSDLRIPVGNSTHRIRLSVWVSVISSLPRMGELLEPVLGFELRDSLDDLLALFSLIDVMDTLSMRSNYNADD